MNDYDRIRFTYGLFNFNDAYPVDNTGYNLEILRKSDFRKIDTFNKKPLVDILSFCLMPNHYHLLAVQREEKGITEFMRKLGTGYTNYFNKKYERSGALFQGKFKAIHIDNDSHLLYLSHYIHLNPLDIFMPEWREGAIKNSQKAMDYLKKYRWSSFLDYTGTENFPFIIEKEFINSLYGSPTSGYKKEIEKWITNYTLNANNDLLLET